MTGARKASAKSATVAQGKPKRKGNVGTFTQGQVDDMVKAAVDRALEARPKDPWLVRWASALLVVIGWAAIVLINAGIYGQRLNSLESAMHDLSANSMPTNTVQAKFDEQTHMLQMMQVQMNETQREVHELTGRK